MPDPDAHAPRASAPSPLEAPDPPIIGGTRFTETKTIGSNRLTSLDDVARAPVTVSVDGNQVLHGTQRVDALALLGIAEDVLDLAWRRFVVDVNATNFAGTNDWGRPDQHQEGMGWQVDVDVVHDRTAGLAGLADIDPRTAQRWVTYCAKRWHYTQADVESGGSGPPSGWTVETRREPLEASGALGASWRTVDESEIESTVTAAEALLAARMELGNACHEIQVALKVADAAWQGPRSEATKFKFGLEHEVISAAWDSAEAWRRYLNELIAQQRDAKKASDDLERQLFVEAGLLLVPFMAGKALKTAFSAGRAAETALAGSRVVTYAQAIGRIVAPLRSRYAAVAGQIARSSVTLHSARVLARGSGGLAATVAVNEAGGETTTEDWLVAFGAAAVGYGFGEAAETFLGSDAARNLLVKVQETHDVEFDPAVTNPTKSVADGVGQSGVEALADEALVAPFAIGVAADPVKNAVEGRVKGYARELLRNDPRSGAMRRAHHRFNAERAAAEGRPRSRLDDLKTLQKYIDEEIDKTLQREVDPLLDFTYSVGTQGAESAHQTVAGQPPTPSPADAPRAPSGTVTQPVAN